MAAMPEPVAGAVLLGVASHLDWNRANTMTSSRGNLKPGKYS